MKEATSRRRRFLSIAGAAVALAPAYAWLGRAGAADIAMTDKTFPIDKPDSEWQDTLSPEQYRVLREHGTERAFGSSLNAEKRTGTFKCAGCDQPLFSSDTKFESGTGWPSFWQPIDGAVGTSKDRSWFMVRTEVHCARCGGHLGHVFDDGPRPTGQRFCMNGAAMTFTPLEK